MTNPMISVVMPVYNAEKYVAEAVESILQQTYSDFEFIIIDDCSTDSSYKILQEYAAKDQRIKLFRNEQNYKQAYTKNRAIEIAQGKYIAFMDADDISLPERFAKQVEFMESHPEIGVCGSLFEPFTNDMNCQLGNMNLPAEHDIIKIYLCMFYNVIAHPTTIIRKQVFSDRSNFYNNIFSGLAEDYELWSRLAYNGAKFHNIQEPLLLYRFSKNQTTKIYAQKIEESIKQIKEANFRCFFGKYCTENEILMITKFPTYSKAKKLLYYRKYNKVIDKTISVNNKTLNFDVNKFNYLVSSLKITLNLITQKLINYLKRYLSQVLL